MSTASRPWRPNKSRRWTDDDEASLQAMVTADRLTGRIATAMGRSESVISERRAGMSVARDDPSPIDIAVRELGGRAVKIAGQYLLDRRPSSPRAIVAAANALGAGIPYPGLNPLDKALR